MSWHLTSSGHSWCRRRRGFIFLEWTGIIWSVHCSLLRSRCICTNKQKRPLQCTEPSYRAKIHVKALLLFPSKIGRSDCFWPLSKPSVFHLQTSCHHVRYARPYSFQTTGVFKLYRQVKTCRNLAPFVWYLTENQARVLKKLHLSLPKTVAHNLFCRPLL